MCKSDLGFYGKDSPAALIKKVLSRISEREKSIDAILIDGDFIKHGLNKN